jgi:hypothetical protein
MELLETHLLRTGSRPDGLTRPTFPGDPMIKASSRASRRASLARLLLISAVCAFTCACGGGGSGGAAEPPVVAPPAPKAELGWDDGNWDQKDWQ